MPAGGAPYLGINALNAAQIGFDGGQRPAGRPSRQRPHPGPSHHDKRRRPGQRGPRLTSASKPMSAAAQWKLSLTPPPGWTGPFKAGADAVGAKCEITNLPAICRRNFSKDLYDLNYEESEDDRRRGAGRVPSPFEHRFRRFGDVSTLCPVSKPASAAQWGCSTARILRSVTRGWPHCTGQTSGCHRHRPAGRWGKTGPGRQGKLPPQDDKTEYLTVWGGMKE